MIVSDHPICFLAPDVSVPVLKGQSECWRIRTIGSLDDVLTELRALVGNAPPGTRTLDLIAHSTRDNHFTRFGTTPLDMHKPSVARVFETIHSEELLKQLGIVAVRLLGCSTATLPTGQRTLRWLAKTLAVPVYGSTKDLTWWHYNEHGFNPKFENTLIEASKIPNRLGQF